MNCQVEGCRKGAHGNGRLCDVHAKHVEWLDNSDLDRMGIVRFSLDLFPQRINTAFGVPYFHREIYSDLLNAQLRGASKLDRLHAIQAPREHSKSTIICFIFVLYSILFQQKKFVLLISESYEKTVQFIRAIKKALRSDLVRYYFGDISATNAVSEGGKWTEGHIITSSGITIMAMGMGKSARGLIEDMRPDLIIADDAESENNTKTEEVREGNWQWWNAQVVPAGDVISGQCVYIGTMVHYDCILARLLEQDNGYHKRFYQVWTDERQTKPLWPEKFPPQLIRQIASMYRADPNRGAALFYMEYMGVAVDPESRTFGPQSIRTADPHFFIERNIPWLTAPMAGNADVAETTNVETFIGVDPASSLRKTARKSCVMVGAVDHAGRVFILEYVLDRLPISTDPDTKKEGIIETIIALCLKYIPSRIGFARTGIGLPIVQQLRKDLETAYAQSKYRNMAPVIVEILETSEEQKVDRIRNVLESPHKQGKVFIRESMIEHKTAYEQFPKCRQFDSLDAETNLLLVTHPPYKVIPYNPMDKERMVEPRRIRRDWELPV